MTARLLHVLAVNADTQIRHTNLTRAREEVTDLPPLADWLKVDRLDTDRIELFPATDLGDMPLTTYLGQAFDIEAPPLTAAAPRLNLIEGPVLLVPSDAVDTAPKPGAEATLMASLPITQPDHVAEAMPKATRQPAPPPPEPEAPPPQGNLTPIVVAAVALATLVVVLLVAWIA